jgi:hypothetical protein
LPVPGDERHRIGHLNAREAPACSFEDGQQKLRLAVTGKTGEPNDLTLMRDQFNTITLLRWACANAERSCPSRNGFFY